MNKKTGLALAVIAVILALLLVGYYLFIYGGLDPDMKTIAVVVSVDGEKSYEIKTDGEFVIDALNDLQASNAGFSFECEMDEYGAYITAINGRYADENAREYFAFYVNGEYSSFGISSHAIADGDEIKLVLERWS